MQENRRQLWAALLSASVSLVLGVMASRERRLPAPPRRPATAHRITRESVRRIRIGMTESQVEALLGAPPGDYTTAGPRLRIAVWNPQGLLQETWESDELVVVVLFLDDLTVSGTYYDVKPSGPRSLLERVEVGRG